MAEQLPDDWWEQYPYDAETLRSMSDEEFNNWISHEGASDEWKDYMREIRAGGAVAGDPSTQTITGLLRERYDLSDEEIDKMIGELGPEWERLAEESGQSVDDVFSQFMEDIDPLMGPIGAPEYGGDISSQAAGAKSDPFFTGRQKDVLDQLMGLTTPEMTAKEQAMMEASRQQREQEFRGQREAIESDLRRRGVGGSGAGLAMTLDASQNMANQRMLEDLMAQGSAVDRAMSALGEAGTVAGQGRQQSFYEDYATRSAADDVAKFNSGMRQEYDMFKTDAELRDLTRRGGLAGEKARLGAGAIADQFNYATAPLTFQERGTGMKVGNTTQGAAQIASAMAQAEGAKQADKATKMLTEDQGWIDDDIPLFGIL